MFPENVERNQSLIRDYERGTKPVKLAKIYRLSLTQVARLIEKYQPKYGKQK